MNCGLSLDPTSIAAWERARMQGPPAPNQRQLSIQTFPATRKEVKIKEYKDSKEFEKDAQKMMNAGWQPEDQSQRGGHVNVGRTATGAVLTGGLSLLLGASRTKGKITVTWIRGGNEAEKLCPQCAVRVPMAAQVCRFCGFRFP
jgi:hypothetical protein